MAIASVCSITPCLATLHFADLKCLCWPISFLSDEHVLNTFNFLDWDLQVWIPNIKAKIFIWFVEMNITTGFFVQITQMILDNPKQLKALEILNYKLHVVAHLPRLPISDYEFRICLWFLMGRYIAVLSRSCTRLVAYIKYSITLGQEFIKWKCHFDNMEIQNVGDRLNLIGLVVCSY